MCLFNKQNSVSICENKHQFVKFSPKFVSFKYLFTKILEINFNLTNSNREHGKGVYQLLRSKPNRVNIFGFMGSFQRFKSGFGLKSRVLWVQLGRLYMDEYMFAMRWVDTEARWDESQHVPTAHILLIFKFYFIKVGSKYHTFELKLL